jgi:DNA modification methylase
MTELVRLGVQVQSVVSDPPYGIGFMSRDWDDPDNIAFRPEVWRLCLQLLPPGGHLVAFGATRTYHRLATAIEDAGFEIRDTLAWVHAQGFPKSRDISKDIDQKFGCEREVIGDRILGRLNTIPGFAGDCALGYERIERNVVLITTPASPEAQEWAGYGTNLKPSMELICLARRPIETTVADCVLAYGTGALNIDGCRIECSDKTIFPKDITSSRGAMLDAMSAAPRPGDNYPNRRFPANVLHDGSAEVLEHFPQSKGQQGDVKGDEPSHIGDSGIYGRYEKTNVPFRKRGDSGSAARFFFCAKASKKERRGSKHPTIKPLSLMRWLVRLVTPPGRLVLDPFAGTGTTGEAAMLEGCDYLLIERNPVYVEDIMKRLPEERMTMNRRRTAWRALRVWLHTTKHRAMLNELT